MTLLPTPPFSPPTKCIRLSLQLLTPSWQPGSSLARLGDHRGLGRLRYHVYRRSAEVVPGARPHQRTVADGGFVTMLPKTTHFRCPWVDCDCGRTLHVPSCNTYVIGGGLRIRDEWSRQHKRENFWHGVCIPHPAHFHPNNLAKIDIAFASGRVRHTVQGELHLSSPMAIRVALRPSHTI